MVDLSIIIVSWNTKDLLRTCLKSIHKEAPNLNYEIFVVDNASSDNSTKMVEEEFPQVRLLKNEKNVGFACANNQAIRQSKGKYLLLLNPDTLILNQAIGKMVGFVSKNKKVGILGPRIFGKDGSLQISCYRFFSLSNLFSTNILFSRIGRGWCYKNFNYNQIKEVDVVTGACLLAREEMIRNTGLLDERFFMYTEDMDWCFRAKKEGWKISYYPEAEIIHIGGVSSENIREKMNIEAYQSHIKFFEKYFSKTKVKLMKILLFSGVFLRVIILSFLTCLKPTQENRIRLQKYWTVFKWYKNVSQKISE